jgi:hypothetical protein
LNIQKKVLAAGNNCHLFEARANGIVEYYERLNVVIVSITIIIIIGMTFSFNFNGFCLIVA